MKKITIVLTQDTKTVDCDVVFDPPVDLDDDGIESDPLYVVGAAVLSAIGKHINLEQRDGGRLN